MRGLLFLTLLISVSCANYVEQMHKSFDAQDEKTTGYRPEKKDRFSMYRNGAQATNSMNNVPNTMNQRSLAPRTQRAYQPAQTVRKRYRAEDLNDNSNDASLWGGDDNAQYLFTQATEKKIGEIILINVNSKLKKEISAELKRAFPDPLPLPQKKGDAAAPAADGAKAAAAPAPAPKPAPAAEEETGEQGKVYDRISSVIIEKINKNHLLLKGRKELLYKKRKRMVEVQALISKKNIGGDDSVNSDEILEQTIRVVR